MKCPAGYPKRDKCVGNPCGVRVMYSEIGNYLNEDFFEMIYYWSLYKEFGLPNGSIGWANEPSDYFDAVVAINSLHNEYEYEQQEKKANANTKTIKAEDIARNTKKKDTE